jgi:uncharacterized protein (DUF1499 family)
VGLEKPFAKGNLTMLTEAAQRTWPRRLARTAFLGGTASAVIAMLGAYGSGWGLWNFQIGFAFLAIAVVLATAAIVSGLISFFVNRGQPGVGTRSTIGMLAAIGLLAVMGNTISKGSKFPMIHDVSTDLANPPAFQSLKLRDDNLVGLEGGMAQWQELHSKAYSDIQPLHLPMPQAEAMDRVRKVVNERGWLVTASTDNRIEATDTVSPFRFKDDIVIVATPESAAVTRIDVRSVSRVGVGDLGMNAKRVRALLVDLQKGI